MNLEQLRHLLRASGRIVGDSQFIVIGSQSILGKFPDAPKELLWSTEADLIAKNKPGLTERLMPSVSSAIFTGRMGFMQTPYQRKPLFCPKAGKVV